MSIRNFFAAMLFFADVCSFSVIINIKLIQYIDTFVKSNLEFIREN